MTTFVVVAVVVVVVAVAVFVAATVGQRRRSTRLQQRFGPEYDRVVENTGDRLEAESTLRDVAYERDHLDIVPLPAESLASYSAQWTEIKSQFVDQPQESVQQADDLITRALNERGYRVDEFDRLAALISVDHPDVVENYRAAHAIRERGAQASTEELRQALVHYRFLANAVLDQKGSDEEPVARTDAHLGES